MFQLTVEEAAALRSQTAILKPEGRVVGHDAHFKTVFDAIRQLMTPPKEPRPPSPRRIGFKP